MNFPAYYVSSPASVVTLPVAERIDSIADEIEEEDIEFVTDGGVRYVYEQFERTILTLHFRVTDSQLTAFETMRSTVGRQPFYFMLNVDDPSGVLYVRRSRHFKPKRLDQMVNEGGSDVFMHDLTIELTTEISALQLEA